MKKYLTIIFCLFSICSFFSAHSKNIDSPESIAADFTRKYYSGDADGAMKLLLVNDAPDNDSKKSNTAQALNMVALINIGNVRSYGGIKSITVKSIEYESENGQKINKDQANDESKARVSIDIVFGYGKIQKHTWVLLKSKKSKQWRLL